MEPRETEDGYLGFGGKAKMVLEKPAVVVDYQDEPHIGLEGLDDGGTSWVDFDQACQIFEALQYALVAYADHQGLALPEYLERIEDE